MTKYKKLVQAMVAAGLLVGMNSAMSAIYYDEGMSKEIARDENYHYTTEGDAWLAGHTYYSGTNSVITIGGNLNRTGPEAEAYLELYDHTTVIVSKDVNLDKVANKGHMEVGGTLNLNILEQHGTLTGIGGAALGKVLVGEFSNHVDGIYNELYVSRVLTNSNADLTMTGTVGSAKQSADISSKNGNLVINGNVYTDRVDMASGNITVNNGALEFNGEFSVTGTGDEVLKANDVVIKGSGTGTIHGSELIANTLTVKAVGIATRLLTIGESVNKPGTLSVNTLMLEGNVNFQHRNNQTKLNLQKVVLNTTSSNYFQSYAGMNLGTVEVVGGDARIDGFAEGGIYDIPFDIKTVDVKKGASLTFTNTVGTGESVATIGTLTLEDGAKFANAAFRTDNGKLRQGYQLFVDNLSAENATITTIHGTTTLGANNGTVQLSGTVNDDKINGGQTILNLNSDQASWVATGASTLTALNSNGGTTDISQTKDDVVVTNLSGTGTVVVDAADDNTLTAENTVDGTKFVVKASKTADEVSTDDAAAMVKRLVGVNDKTGSVDEGMYKGAISVDGEGNASQGNNSLMSDTLDMAAASALSLNRILMNDVRKRLGDIRSLEATNGVWARYDGGRLKGEGTTHKFNTIQIGGDIAPFADNSIRLGVAASYTNGDVDYTRGSSDLDAYSLALYGTWMADNGLFADVIARVAKNKLDMTVDGIYKGDLDNTAYSLSGELGWRFDLNDMFYAEPQVEMTYTYMDSDEMTLKGNGQAFGYAIDSFDSLIGRAGVLAGAKFPDQKGSLYVRASLVHEFLGDSTITGGNVAKIESDGQDTWVEYGIGANFNLTKNAYIWADIERTSGATIEEEWRGTVGVRYAF
ncbi:MAG: autotransporter outer membrane beta-barrel domain-containing protein [Sutterellaceae bacterium]|nr:autotransporter outer membrane beta-barrel domain-containing protein [Sutterellaceae bacterium]